ncbi:GTPase activating protein [Fomitiporia mediterranea MF3/22]|uniref:GTPase activating protein n=1 Tax=Fomitiporia mediterranea (strain MF3/22) TaxID=694068 RepID=UPI0004408C31|nr:GTPase activating protein [Fomitiporia mediterranea MF3/22]EJD03956.1 GTPase activating protein [Fomitiporia mediterranea MF3/22]
MAASGSDVLISDSWYEDSSWQNAGTREFMASIELWVPAKATNASTRKPHLPRKASEKRDSIGAVLSGDERKIREKPSWFRSHVNTVAANGSWRPARCKLLEEHDRCTLNIYVDETILQYSIYVHLLRSTDIRPADRSLFFRDNCLGIHVKPGQRWLDTNTEEIVYVKFPTSDSINTWIALLRSYAVAEIYGRNHAPKDGGLYRMWRQVQLEINQARNLGSSKPPTELASSPMSSEFDGSSDGVDMEVSCEVYITDELCGRTTVKKSVGSPEWHEQFTFSDLPPFGDLLVHVYREKKVFKPQLLGTVQIPLNNVRKGEVMEGWHAVIATNQSVSGTQVGELRLRMNVDEEIVLPTSAYSSVLDCMSQRNLLDLLHDLEQELKLDHIAEHVLAIAVVRNVLMRDLFELSEREVDGTSSTQNTLFRGNSVLTKTIELAMNWYGKPFLEASVGPVVRRLVSEKVVIEVDPVRSGRGPKDQEKNVDLLVYWCKEVWNHIYSVRDECPQELRQLFQHIRQLVEKRFESGNRDLRWQSVSAFIFLRFIVPSVLHPHLFGLCHGMPPAPVQRSLTLIAKVMQSLANLNPTVQKEEFMRGLKDFMQASLPAMIDYIKEVSTPSSERFQSRLPSHVDKHDRICVMNALHERKPDMPTLHREALLFLPHLLDIPRHLAVLTSAVVRNMRDTKYQRNKVPSQYSNSLWHFTRCCLEVENVALKCVSQLRPRIHGARSQSAPLNPPYHQVHSQVDSPHGAPVDSPRRAGKTRLNTNLPRPATAPSTPDTEAPFATYMEYTANLPSSPASPVAENLLRYSSGSESVQTQSTLTPREGGTPKDKDRPEGNGSRLRSGGKVEDEADTFCVPDTADDTKKRKRFLRGFLTKR